MNFLETIPEYAKEHAPWLFTPEAYYVVAALNLIFGIRNVRDKNATWKVIGGMQLILSLLGTFGGLVKQGII